MLSNSILNNKKLLEICFYSEGLTSSSEWEIICSFINKGGSLTLITIGPVQSWWAFFHTISIFWITNGTRRTVASFLASFSPAIWRAFCFTFRAGETHFAFTFSCLENNGILQCLWRISRTTSNLVKNILNTP